MRGKLVPFANFAAGGAAITFLVEAQWLAGLALLIVYVGLVVEIPKVVRWYGSRSYGALAVVVPVAPLDPSRPVDAKEAAKNTDVGVDMLRQAVKDQRSVELLLASGFRVVGWERDPGWLFDSLRGRAKDLDLNVLLLNPDCQSSKDRAGQVLSPYTHAQYRAGTMAVLSTFKRWRDELGMNITVKLYEEPPIWQMVRLPKELWLMFASTNRGTDFSPFYVFRRDAPYSLAWGLDAVWTRRWDHDSTIDVAWSEVAPPAPADVIAVPGVGR